MSVGSKMAWAGLLGGAILLGAQGTCFAGTEDAPPAAASGAEANPYSIITERNPFRLNPPPPPAEPAKLPSPDLPVVTLSGFVRTGNQWKVMLAVKVRNPDPKAAPLNSYMALAEGDKKGVTSGENQFVVELVKVHADQEKAEIINSGTPVTLSMEVNGFASPAAAPDPSRPRTMTPEMRKALEVAHPRPTMPPPKVPGVSEVGVLGAAKP
jgi:hypothetical protein